MFYILIDYFYNTLSFVFFSNFYLSYELFNIILLLLILFFSIWMILIPTINMIHSVLLFILIIFFSALFVSSLTKFYFVSFVICLIYVGAISILLIFTLMVLEVKVKLFSSSSKINLINIIFIYTLFYYFLFFFLFFNTDYFFIIDYNFLSLENSKEFFFKSFYSNWNDLTVIGFYLFNYRIVEILILTFLLISGLISSISIVVLKTFSPKTQNLNNQLFENYNLFFKIKKINKNE